MKKTKKAEIVLVVLVLLDVAVGLLLPKTGELILLAELCNTSIIWIVFVYLVVKVVKNRKALAASGKVIGTVLIILCFVFGIWFSKDIALDLFTGSQTIKLNDIQVSQSQGHTGIFSHHYYLTGFDQDDQTLRLEISGKEYESLKDDRSVMVEYYKHTGRIVRVLN